MLLMFVSFSDFYRFVCGVEYLLIESVPYRKVFTAPLIDLRLVCA